MRVFRICKKKHAGTAFSGIGSELVSGRWHEAGSRVVYCSTALSLATLEILVHAPPELFNIPHVWFEVSIPDRILTEEVSLTTLSKGWVEYSAPEETRSLGSEWLKRRSSCALLVPSVVIPHERNCLLNPDHPDFDRLQISKAQTFRFDSRLQKP